MLISVLCSGMLSSFAYVAWTDGQGIGHIGTYWIDDKDSMGIHPTAELLSNKKCERTDGIITFEFSRPLQPDCQSGQECKNVIDPMGALKMVWAIGDEWSGKPFLSLLCCIHLEYKKQRNEFEY
jgi:hypothetical protein